jgi:hypothetical protein
MHIIAKLSFWILKPKKQVLKKSIMAKLSLRPFKKMLPFEELIMDALAQFRMEGYVEKLKTSIALESLPSNKKDLLAHLYNEIAYA